MNVLCLSFNFGVWLSPVERVVWDHEVGGSNPLTPNVVQFCASSSVG